jgi:hypothetical protein
MVKTDISGATMAVPLRVTVSPDRVSAASEDSRAVAVTVRNTSDIVEHYEIDVTGLPEGGGFRAEPDVTKLRPGETGEVTVHLTLAADPPAAAGEHTLGVVVRSRYRGDVSRCEEVTLTVAPIDEITVRIEPEVVTGGRFAHYTVAVTNDGNTPVALRLASTDPERHVSATFQPATLDLIPGASAQSTMSVAAPIPWSREKQRTLKIKAVGVGVAGEGSATFVQRPRFAPGVTRTAGVLGAVAVLAAAIVAAAVIGKGEPESDSESKTSTVTPPAGGTGPSATTTAGAGPAASAAPSSETSVDASGSTSGEGGVPITVDLVPPEGAPVGGPVDSDAFSASRITLSGLADRTGPCADATAVVVAGDAAGGQFLTAARLADHAACNERGIAIRFTDGAASVEVDLGGTGGAVMEVGYQDGEVGRAESTAQNTLAADGRDHQGIAFVNIQVVRPPTEPGTAAVLGGARRLRYTPMAPSPGG